MEAIMQKVCNACLESKLIEAFPKNKEKKDGVSAICKSCRNTKQKQKYHSDPVYRATCLAAGNKYYAGCDKEAKSRWGKEYLKLHKAEIYATKKKYLSNPEIAAKRKVQLSEAWAKRYAADPQKYRDIRANYDRMHPEQHKLRGQNRRAKKRGALGKLSIGLSEKLMTLQRGKCACCKTNLKISKHHLDHVMPLSRGGANEDTNIQLLCPPCNLKKHAKLPLDFMQSQGFLL